MNKRLKDFSWGAMFILVLSLISGVYAQPVEGGYKKGMMEREEKFDAIVKELNLSPRQQQEIAVHRSKEKEQFQELGQKFASVQKELRQELDKDKPDRAKVHVLVAQMKELIGRRYEQRVSGILSLKEILTPEQFKKLNEKTKRLEWKKKEAGHEKISYRGGCGGSFSHRGKRAVFCQRLG